MPEQTKQQARLTVNGQTYIHGDLKSLKMILNNIMGADMDPAEHAQYMNYLQTHWTGRVIPGKTKLTIL